MTVFGSTVPTAGTIAGTLGYALPALREYSRLDNIMADYRSIGAAGEQLVASLKWDLNKPFGAIPAGPVDPSLIVPAQGQVGRFDTEIQAHASTALEGSGTIWGPAVVAHNHEPDHKPIAGGPALQVAANLHANKVARSVPGFMEWCQIGFIAVDYDETLLAAFDACYRDADIILIDACYCNDGGKTSARAILGDRVATLRTRYPHKPLGLGEFGCTAGPGRAAWLRAAMQYFEDEGLELALYWDNGNYRLSNSPADLTEFCLGAGAGATRTLANRVHEARAVLEGL